LENLFLSWREFRRGKKGKLDVQKYEFALEDNLLKLHYQLKNKNYKHSSYSPFYVRDPKLRHIHKARVRDRVLHQAVYRILYPIFDKQFIFDSYSCRLGKGTHTAIKRLEIFCRKASGNNTKNIFALKCDVKKFFDSIDQNILKELLGREIDDPDTMWLIEKIINSFEKVKNKGLPLGNVTSQLFANIYLNELDQFVKHQLKAKYYLRYCDDFIILSEDKESLEEQIEPIQKFLWDSLKLELHDNKVFIRKFRQGIDFLGYVILPHYRVLRTKTKRRIFKKISQKKSDLLNGKISEESFDHTFQSYLGILKHCSGYKIRKQITDILGIEPY